MYWLMLSNIFLYSSWLRVDWAMISLIWPTSTANTNTPNSHANSMNTICALFSVFTFGFFPMEMAVLVAKKKH